MGNNDRLCSKRSKVAMWVVMTHCNWMIVTCQMICSDKCTLLLKKQHLNNHCSNSKMCDFADYNTTASLEKKDDTGIFFCHLQNLSINLTFFLGKRPVLIVRFSIIMLCFWREWIILATICWSILLHLLWEGLCWLNL